jgi:hypothetical protein
MLSPAGGGARRVGVVALFEPGTLSGMTTSVLLIEAVHLRQRRIMALACIGSTLSSVGNAKAHSRLNTKKFSISLAMTVKWAGTVLSVLPELLNTLSS